MSYPQGYPQRQSDSAHPAPGNTPTTGTFGTFGTLPGHDLAVTLSVSESLERIARALERVARATEGGALEEEKPRRRRRGQIKNGVKTDDPRVMARSFIRVMLLDGPKPWKQIAEAGKGRGHSAHTMRDERSVVAYKKFHQGDDLRPNRWLWHLKEEVRNG